MDRYTANEIINKYSEPFYKIIFDSDTNVFKTYITSWIYEEAILIPAEYIARSATLNNTKTA